MGRHGNKRQLDIVESHVREHPDTASRKIATYLFGRYPGLWTSHNAVLHQVRRMRGVDGKLNREKMKAGTKPLPYIPGGSKKRKKATKRLNDAGRWLIIGDLHVPFHDQRALSAAINHGIDQKAEHLLINGDALDAYQASMWVKDPNQRSIDKEIIVLKGILKGIEKEFSGRKIYKIGNHEARIENYLYQNAPRMIGMSKWDLCEALKRELELGDDWEFIDSKQLYTLGKLRGYHGHELPKGLTNPVSVGRGLFLRAHEHAFTNHWHQTSTHMETNGSKTKTWVCFSVGCLCDLQPNYAPVNRWNHGHAIVDIWKTGEFSEHNHRIDKGQIW